MPKQIYIPTEEELIEMGFRKQTSIELHEEPKFYWRYYYCTKEFSIYYKFEGFYWNEVFYIESYHECDECWHESEPRISFYPRSKQALIEFISNFSPNE